MPGKVSIIKDNYVWCIFKTNSCTTWWTQQPVQSCNDDYISPVAAAAVGCSCPHYFILSLLETGVQFSQLSVRDYSSLLIFLSSPIYINIIWKRNPMCLKKKPIKFKKAFSPVSFTLKVYNKIKMHINYRDFKKK